MDSVKDFYEGSSVLITGVTGFLGKLLLRKLLVSCKDVDIFILLRKKGGEDIETRLKNVFENPIFDEIKEVTPNFLEKVHPIEGDFSKSNLNLTEINQNLIIEKVNIVFHCAADLNMQEKFTVSVNTNIRGTKELIELCDKINDLKAVIVVSTMYSNCQYPVIEEKIYPNRIKAEHILSLLEDVNEETIESIKDTIIEKSPNIYCYTKALAEEMIHDMGQNLPIGIFRPSIITSTYKDPFPGWTDSINGVLGPYFLILMGIWRVTFGKGYSKSDFVPADFCVNAMICAAWDVYKKRKTSVEMPIYNFCNTSRNCLTYKEATDKLQANFKYAFKGTMWAPYFIYVPNKFLSHILHFVLHTFPAYTYDCYKILTRKRPKLVKAYTKINNLLNAISYFNLHEWVFKRDNVEKLWKNLSDADKKLFNFDVNSIDYDNYFANISIGFKKFYLKETISNEDVYKLNRLKMYHKISVVLALILTITIVFLLEYYCNFFDKVVSLIF